MVGPFMQGMVLLGIIYWYSKGMMSLINDYYRGEFQRKLKTEKLENDSSYQEFADIDAIVTHSLQQVSKVIAEDRATATLPNMRWQLQKGAGMSHVCYRGDGLQQLLRLLAQLGTRGQHGSAKYCWADGYNVNVDK